MQNHNPVLPTCSAIVTHREVLLVPNERDLVASPHCIGTHFFAYQSVILWVLVGF